MKKLFFCDNSLSSLINFRGALIEYLIDKGYEITAIVPPNANFDKVLPKGLIVEQQLMTRSSFNIFKDRYYILALYKFIKRKPSHVFSYTIKPNIYSVWLCKLWKVPVTIMVPGMGYVANNKSIAARVGKWLYKTTLRNSSSILVLNESNRDCLIHEFGVASQKVKLLTGGEGVNLKYYTPMLPSNRSVSAVNKVVFLMIGRVLLDKGYREYVSAARQLKLKYPNVEFQLLGEVDMENPERVPSNEFEQDVESGVINYLGYVSNIKEVMAKASVFVLPSYHEGLSRSLMEACAMGKPIVCSDIPGCKETVDDKVNGFLVESRNAQSLEDALERMILMDATELNVMGECSRAKAEREFGLDKVFEVYDNELKG